MRVNVSENQNPIHGKELKMKKIRRITSLALALVLLLISVCGCQSAATPGKTDGTGNKTGEYNDTDKSGEQISGSGAKIQYLTSRTFSSDRKAEKIADEFQKSLADLTLKLLNSCYADNKKDSTMISSLSIVTALAMAANGAEGNTLKQMEDIIGCGQNIEGLNQQLFNLYSSLTSTANASFKAANSAWVSSDPSFHINNNFIKRIENTFDADIVSIDYSDAAKAAESINGWCNEKTDGMIPQVVSEDVLSADTVLCLLNALCFDALWQEQVPDYAVHDMTFRGFKGDVTASFLFSEENTYISGKNVTGFVKPYCGGQYAFAVLLPDEGISVSDYLAALDGNTLTTLLKGTSREKVVTRMPEFSSDYSVSLKDILKSFGMTDAFSSCADFTGMGQSDLGPVKISDVIHKTHIEVDNSGTRAAAVTAVICDAKNCDIEQPKMVTVDRPFIYAITDVNTGMPLFIGTCDNITK